VYDKVAKKKMDIDQEKHFKNCTSTVVKAIESSGLKVDMYYSIQKDEIYVRLGATEVRISVVVDSVHTAERVLGATQARLMREADRIDFDLQLDHHKCLEYGQGLGVRLAQKYVARA